MRAFTTALMLTLCTSLTAATYSVKLDEFKRPSSSAYLKACQANIEHSETHPNAIPKLPIFEKGVAIIVGSGTIGMEACVFAARTMPKGSNIVVIQNDIKNGDHLEKILLDTVDGGENFNWLISDAMDIGQLDQLKKWLNVRKSLLKDTRLLIHTADAAERFIPDRVDIDKTLTQIVRRASVATISQELDSFCEGKIVKILISSECAQNRDQYRIPNLAAYQFGKVVGDWLFTGTQGNPKSTQIIAYSGPMDTQGQTRARHSEYEALKPKGIANSETYIEEHKKAVDIDPMDSVGAMLKTIYSALINEELESGKQYRLYSASVNPELGHTVCELEEVPQAKYLWPPLEDAS